MSWFEIIFIVVVIPVLTYFHCIWWKEYGTIRTRKDKRGSFVIRKEEKEDDVK